MKTKLETFQEWAAQVGPPPIPILASRHPVDEYNPGIVDQLMEDLANGVPTRVALAEALEALEHLNMSSRDWESEEDFSMCVTYSL